MSVIEKLASALGRRDEVPNQELAREIVAKGNKAAVKELTELLQNHKDKNIQSDCIKVLYEIGEAEPPLIAKYIPVFVNTLEHKNNRLVWGAMTALDTVATIRAKEIYDHLPSILEAMDKGSVITKDHGIGILIKLAQVKKYKEAAFSLLLEQMRACPYKQIPMYAERVLVAIDENNKEEFISTLESRIPDLEKESQRKRVAKVIKKCS